MKNKIFFTAILFCPICLLAQEEQFPQKHENADWYWMIRLKFRIDKKAEAYEILKITGARSKTGLANISMFCSLKQGNGI